MFKKWLFSLLLILPLFFAALPAKAVCDGEFANPITDYCWSCVLPIRVAGAAIATNSQEDNKSSDGLKALCNCGAKFGVPISFWEMSRLVDVTRDPYCFVGLGGVDLGGANSGLPIDYDGYTETKDNQVSKVSFYHVHYYLNSVMYWLEVLSENDCLEQKGFDLAYMTEADPTWGDPDLASIFNPDVFLFANPVAEVACSADCLATASTTTSMDPTIRNSMYWCSGCLGATFPLTGHVKHYNGSAADAPLLMHRMIAKLHREGAMLASSGTQGLCGYYPKFQMDKTDYKWMYTYPIPGTQKFDGRCCQSVGASTIQSGSRQEYPGKGEHWSLLVYRKRDCCQGAEGLVK